MKFIYAMAASAAIVAFSAYQASAVDVKVGPQGGARVDVPAAGVHVDTIRPNAAVNPTVNAPNVDVRTNGPAAARQEARETVREERAMNNGLITDNRPDQWRYKYEGNRWWYYGPDNRWMWYTTPGGWTYYDQGNGYTTGYGGVPVAPNAAVVAPVPDYSAPSYYTPGYYPSNGYYNGYYNGYNRGYYGNGFYIGGPRWGVGVGGRRW